MSSERESSARTKKLRRAPEFVKRLEPTDGGRGLRACNLYRGFNPAARERVGRPEHQGSVSRSNIGIHRSLE